MNQYNLIISSRAEERIDSVVDFLLIEWGVQAQQKFLAELRHCFKIIEINPCAFPYMSDSTIVRQCLVNSLSKLYYSIQGEDIIILSLEDVRMNPKNIRF